MSSHAPDRARVVPLRRAEPTPPETARATRPTRPGKPGTHEKPAAPGKPAKEPLWRHVVGGVLRRERLAQERTLQDVADAARISMPYLSELERGRKEASSEVLAAAARALGLSLADLLALAHEELVTASAAPVVELSARRTSPRGPRPGEVRLAA
ncbi:helix-turn-helix transcriptional regulator [Streptomyces sp. B1866]|uniref:helix-turn-helix domain-containing protein n=1 Tax=Streptomyces sp. B1866 TaxID=3075431 RepID=UPI00288C8715|nr:helix-turn-helix transcriptional regulator [Streptomyces sp. B1866]MDT3395074.1 helix-turn-helix transcriptional regulator [Streptomyces sp. B1866]